MSSSHSDPFPLPVGTAPVSHIKVKKTIYRVVRYYYEKYKLQEEILSSKAPRVDGHLRAIIVDDQGYRCALCNHTFRGGFHIDHRHPQHLGGDSSRENLWALCQGCHGFKTMNERHLRVKELREDNLTVQRLEQLSGDARALDKASKHGTSLCLACGEEHPSDTVHCCTRCAASRVPSSYTLDAADLIQELNLVVKWKLRSMF
jgi:5-methylcytosine-specific restriction endonuclease McrA